MIDPGLYLLNKSDIYWVTPRRSLPTAFKLFTGQSSNPSKLHLNVHWIKTSSHHSNLEALFSVLLYIYKTKTLVICIKA